MSKRIIIGETERAGLPISAPVLGSTEPHHRVRWRKRKDSFVLEFWSVTEWVEVPFVETP